MCWLCIACIGSHACSSLLGVSVTSKKHGLVMYDLDVYMNHYGLILKFTSGTIARSDSQALEGQDDTLQSLERFHAS